MLTSPTEVAPGGRSTTSSGHFFRGLVPPGVQIGPIILRAEFHRQANAMPHFAALLVALLSNIDNLDENDIVKTNRVLDVVDSVGGQLRLVHQAPRAVVLELDEGAVGFQAGYRTSLDCVGRWGVRPSSGAAYAAAAVTAAASCSAAAAGGAAAVVDTAGAVAIHELSTASTPRCRLL